MAYARIDYGMQTPQSLDRFGTEQTYRVYAVNGERHDCHVVEPVRSNGVLQRLGLRITKWAHNRHHGIHDYELDIHGRTLKIRHFGDGRIKLTLDGKRAYAETKKWRWTGGIQVPEIVIEGPENETPKPTRKVRPNSSMTYKQIQELLQKGIPE